LADQQYVVERPKKWFGTAIAFTESVLMLWHGSSVTSRSPDTLKGRTLSVNREIYPNLKLRIYTTGIRQNRLARMLSIDEAHLSRIINGFRQPSGDIREHLAAILQSDPEWLFYKMQVSDESLPGEGKPQEILK
jgi:hypothetical protein